MAGRGRPIPLDDPRDSLSLATGRADRRDGDHPAAQARADLAQLLHQVALGDRVAFRAVFERTSSLVFATLLRMLGEHAAAHDALQDVYVRVWSEASRFDEARASPITWIAAIARNRAIDLLRSHRRPAPLDDQTDFADPAISALDAMLDREEAMRLDSCLRGLPDDSRKALMDAYFGGMTHEELSRSSGLPLGTVKSRIRRALVRLRTCMEQGE